MKTKLKIFTTFMLLALGQRQNNAAFLRAQEPKLPILAIDFFGYGSLDLNQVRAHLPVHVGQSFSSYAEERSHAPEIRASVLQATGKPVSSLSNIQVEGGYLIYIGLPGSTLQKFQTEDAPTGSIRLPEAAKALYQQQIELLPKAIAAGATEEDSQGYALSSFPDLRKAELEAHTYVLSNETLIRRVLAGSSEKDDRVAAANLLGYADVSPEQLHSLVKACYDPDSLVRNNAVRSIGAIASAKPNLLIEVSLTPFVQMLSSDRWTDRNKSGWVLDSVTKSRNPEVLAYLRSQALAPLIEMARWHDYGHAGSFRLILGRIAGIDEANLQVEAMDVNQVDSIVAAAQRSSHQ